MSIKKYTITIETSNVDANNSYINCYSIGNIVFVEGHVKTKKSISTYTGLGIAKIFRSQNQLKVWFIFNRVLQMVYMLQLCQESGKMDGYLLMHETSQ